jgi:hypothetical protein
MKRRYSTPRTPAQSAVQALLLLALNFTVWALLYYLYLCAL